MRRLLPILVMFVGCGLASACREAPSDAVEPGWLAGWVWVPSGKYTVGSTPEERRAALSHVPCESVDRLAARAEAELPASEVQSGGFLIGEFPVTNRQYAAFVSETGHRTPSISKQEWQAQQASRWIGFASDGDFELYWLPLAWIDRQPPAHLLDAPVVMVSRADAEAYCRWLADKTGLRVRLPDQVESEVIGGPSEYPWGAGWQFGRCHAHREARGPAPVGEPDNRIPGLPEPDYGRLWDTTQLGVKDYAGQVWEWTSGPTSVRGLAAAKGAGSWACGPFECRRSAVRLVEPELRHLLIGFRVMVEPPAKAQSGWQSKLTELQSVASR